MVWPAVYSVQIGRDWVIDTFGNELVARTDVGVAEFPSGSGDYLGWSDTLDDGSGNAVGFASEVFATASVCDVGV
jgi:hypothetical protein